MNWKQLLKISLLALTLAACEGHDKNNIENESPVKYEVNEKAIAAPDKASKYDVPVIETKADSKQEEVKYLWTSNTRYLEEFKEAEAIAIKQGAGLWQLEK